MLRSRLAVLVAQLLALVALAPAAGAADSSPPGSPAPVTATPYNTPGSLLVEWHTPPDGGPVTVDPDRAQH